MNSSKPEPADGAASAEFGPVIQSMARRCSECRVCQYARKHQGGLVNMLMRVENRICPFARAYKKVYGRLPADPEPTLQIQT